MAKRAAEGSEMQAEEHGTFVVAADGTVQEGVPPAGVGRADEPMPPVAHETGGPPPHRDDVIMAPMEGMPHWSPTGAKPAEPRSQGSTATSTPVQAPAAAPSHTGAKGPEHMSPRLEHVSTSPEAREKAKVSHYGSLSVKELKARLTAMGVGITGLAEKEELVELLEELDAERQQEQKTHSTVAEGSSVPMPPPYEF